MHRLLWIAVTVLGCLEVPATAEDPFDREPISYSTSEPGDAVARLRQRIDRGELELKHDAEHGYLKAVLKELSVPVSSQVLVFSKTSFQPTRISPRKPRALYFNDEVYVGWVQRSDTLELSVADPKLGTNFYTLTHDDDRPVLQRQTQQCLQCHGSSQTDQLPGHIVRSVYPSADGTPIFRAGTFRTDQRSPMRERWGGWYVTGEHGRHRHMGNVVVEDPDKPEVLDTEAGANVSDLSDRFDTTAYLSGHSDVVALMVLEHQTYVHNLITAVNFETRRALHYQAMMNELLEEPADHVSDSTKSRIERVCRRLVEAMLFADETRLSDSIVGSSDFAREFAARGPADEQGRSLRQFDLRQRMFRYPCSYLIYSPAFNGLPAAALEQVYRQLHEVLTGKDTSKTFAHLAESDRRAILEILRATKRDLPGDWR